ncbi:unnamed protein product [Adineta steineri]|uniref:Uncharacterized protein n=1 Tax=Adineta steineri TaxID=433720 RepID=A0A819H122_9BILA|nr:unnamed protein product [Adineta steineri]
MLTINSCLSEFILTNTLFWAGIFTLINDLQQIQHKDSFCVFRCYLIHCGCFLQGHSYLLQAIYRYIKIIYPSRLSWQSRQNQLLLIGTIWILAFVHAIPFLFFDGIVYNVHNQVCQMVLGFYFLMIYMMFTDYILPMILIMLVYFKLLRYVKKMSKRVTSTNTLSRAQRELKMVRRTVIMITTTSPIPDEDPGWRNDLDNNQNLEWHQFPSTTAEKRSFILKYPDDKEILQSSEQHFARLIGTAHLASRDSPSCLTFIYQITGDKSNKLSVIIDKQHIWRSRLVQKHGQTQVQLNISSSTTTGITRTATRIAFDGQLTDNVEIKLENILTNHQPCPSSIKSSPSRTIRSLTSKTVPGYDCTFEQDMCGWTQGQNTTLDWFREQPASNPLADVIGPLTDHTYGNSTGYYVTSRKEIPGIRFSDIDISALVSPRLPDNTAGPMCADWWYMMHGTDDTELNLFLVANENFTSPISFWKRSGNQGRHWHHGRLQIDPGNQITRVMYYIFARWSIRSEVSLDDLTLIDGPCIKSDFYTIDCTFEEEHICGYLSDPTGQFPWNRGQGSALTGASQDHTLGTAQGHFMYTGNPQKPGYKARLISVIEEPEKGRCLEFWYHMYGQNIGQLNIYANTNTSNNDVRTLLWSRSANIGDVWRKALVSTEYTVPFRIIFEGVIGNGIEGDIAIDDIQRLSKSCKEPNNCDFEDDTLCGWKNIQTDQFDWEITSGASSIGTFASGPFQDHTLGTDEGSYVYIDRNKNRDINDTAILVSQSMTDTGVNGMYGRGASRLTVYLQMEGFQPLPIWTLADEQEDAWFQGKVGFVASNEHSILIEGKITQYGEGSIGLDDISITSGYCTLLPQHAVPESGLTTTAAAPITTVTTPSHPPTPFDCDFESATCASWSIISKPELTWTRAQGAVATQEDAHNLIYDHTGNQALGYYLLLKPNTTTPFPNNNITSQLRSSTMTDNRQCLEFWYFMYGPHVGTLNVKKISGVFSQLRWSTTRGKGYEWLHARVNLQSSTSNPTQFNIAIEGTWSGDNRGSIAIDDIILLNGTCRTSSDQCDFDSDDSICGFQYSTTGQFNWTRGLASVVQAGINPNVDHTTQTGEGYYMLAEGKNRNANDRALLLTPIQDRTTGSCLHFWYFQHAATKQMKLNVYVLSQSSILWSHDGSLDNRWLYAQININSPSQSWQAVFESEVLAQNPDASVAIDDVSITRGLCPKPGDCTFETDLCGWESTYFDTEMDWIVGRGIHSFGTGPQYDHTTNTAQGKYLMIETSWPTEEGDRARLQSVVFDETNGDSRCFRFWYHMYGDSIGTLNVYLFNGTYTRLWSLSGDRGNNWYEGQVSYTSSIRHQIIVEGIAGKDYLGDISIDDFTFTTSNCSIRPIHDTVSTVETTMLSTMPLTITEITAATTIATTTITETTATTTIATTTATTITATTTIATTTITETTATTTITETTATTITAATTIAAITITETTATTITATTTIATTTMTETTATATTTTISAIEVTHPPSEDEPNLALILGLSMGIGIPALLLIIGGLVCYLKTRFPNAKVEPAAANTALSAVTDIPLVPINTTEKNSTLAAVVV